MGGPMEDQVAFREALSHHQAGRLDEAAAAYRRILAVRPDDGPSLHHLGLIALRHGDAAAAADLITRSIAVAPGDPAAHANLGNALVALGRPAEAVACFEAAARLAPDAANPHFNLGNTLAGLGRGEEAAACFRRALALDPSRPATHNNLGMVLRDLGRLDAAIAAYEAALALAPAYAEAHNNLGNAFLDAERPADAAAAFRRAIALKPDFFQAHANLGPALTRLGRADEAVASCRRAIALRPDHAEALSNLGAAFDALGKPDEAVAAYRQAIALQPGNPVVHANCGAALHALGRYADAEAACRAAIALRPGHAEAHCNLGAALYAQGRLDDAAAACRQAVALRPGYAEALSNLGAILEALRRFDEAIAACRDAIAAAPGHYDAYLNLGAVFQKLGRVGDALAALRQAMALRPDRAAPLLQAIHLRRLSCDWDGLADDERRFLALLRQGDEAVPPFNILCIDATPADQLACARRTTRLLAAPAGAAHDRARPGGKIRLGYLSSDFRNHAVSFLVVEMLERHDRARFTVNGYCIGWDDGSAMRNRVVAAFDRFTDLADLSHADAARRIREDGIDILVDLNGYTMFARTAIVALRPAPVQVNFLGYPGTMGAEFIDYIIADPVTVPMGEAAFYDEKIVRLPDCYQPNDGLRPIAPTPSRRECGLPDDALVFCCFNSTYKITPALFGLWMRLLRAVPHALLWLFQSSVGVEANLRREAAAAGIDPGRLVFAPKLPLAEHLARHRLADLFLDTLPYNAHTTASDALWAGLPVLTCRGGTFAGRVAAGLLTAIGLPDLITESYEDYERKALELAQDGAALAEVKARLGRQRLGAPLFDGGRFARNIETAYERMWETWLAGEAARDITVL